MKKIFFAIIIFVTAISAVSADTVAFTALYPTPQGSFDSFKLIPQSETATGTGSLGQPCQVPGKIFFSLENNTHYSCNKNLLEGTSGYSWGYLPGVWRQQGNTIFLSETLNPVTTYIGIGTPETYTTHKLTIANDGSIVAAGPLSGPEGVLSYFNNLTTSGSGTRFIWWPEKAAVRAGGIQTAPDHLDYAINSLFFTPAWDAASIANYSVAFGINNEARGPYSGILGGEYNLIDMPALHSVILNSALSASITLASIASVSAGGTIADSTHSFASGTHAEISQSNYSAILNSGGIARAPYSFIGGAVPNPDSSYNPWEVLGELTTLSNLEIQIFPDTCAAVDNSYGALITNGLCPSEMCEDDRPISHGTFLGGYGVMNCSEYGFTGGGSQHMMHESPLSVIGGGQRNSMIYGYNNTILGGENNRAGGGQLPLPPASPAVMHYGSYQFIGGGKDNIVHTDYSVVAGGENNEAGSLKNSGLHATHAAVGGGKGNKSWGKASFIGGGENNRIGACGDANCSTIINDPSDNSGSHAVIMGGKNNRNAGDYAFIGAGENNTITENGDYSVIEGGKNVTVNGAYSWAFGKNVVVNADNSWVFGFTNDDADPITVDKNNVVIFYNEDAPVFLSNHIVTNTVLNFLQPGELPETWGVNAVVEVGSLKAETLILTEPPVSTTPIANLSIINDCLPTGYGACIGQEDLAEVFDSSEEVSPGDLLVLDDNSREIILAKSRRAYDGNIIGVVSSSPAMIFNDEALVSDFSTTAEKTIKPPVALTGQVPCKVTLENGPIAYGDLLTSSSTPGHAMKATDRERSLGAVVGKALEPFDEKTNKGAETGMITIFVSLQ
ncbi:MAG: hypothetical protein AB1650_09645 [Candidatus Omnitrophota bacterium]